MTARPIVTDPDTGIPDLIRRLTDDSKRLVTDEFQLAKLETTESLHRATRGALWLGLAFGVAVIMLVALTVFVATLIGRIANGHMWVGALITGAIELGVGFWMLKHGLSTYTQPSYSLEETRSSLADTKHWATTQKRA
ncbi:MAG TPA: phage holin family protein [Gemmatimonadaceae bacterium]|nr:phage holin family protein [Gemmatimonadaceae bacterium]